MQRSLQAIYVLAAKAEIRNRNPPCNHQTAVIVPVAADFTRQYRRLREYKHVQHFLAVGWDQPSRRFDIDAALESKQELMGLVVGFVLAPDAAFRAGRNHVRQTPDQVGITEV